MNETVTAVYAHGVLRPLMPLHMPERTHVQICILAEPAKTASACDRSCWMQASSDRVRRKSLSNRSRRRRSSLPPGHWLPLGLFQNWSWRNAAKDDDIEQHHRI